jgi:transcriptional regulator with XRE-family HTH domain
MREHDWSVETLREKSGLTIDRSTLSRKLNGKTPMTLSEAEALAQALSVTIAWVPSHA